MVAAVAPIYADAELTLVVYPDSIAPTHGRFFLDNAKELSRFLENVERRAFRMAEIATGHREDALDIVQDAMFKLVDKYATRGPDEWGPLFYRILQSRIKDRYRRNAVKRRFFSLIGSRPEDGEHSFDIEQLADPAAVEPDRELQTRQQIARLEPALRALPIRQQQVFLLRLWEGLDVKQTALAMGCSQSSVKTHYARALSTLRSKLTGPGIADE